MRTSEALLALASQAQRDPDAVPVLGDLIIEADWRTDDRDVLAMALCFGGPLDPVPPDHLATREARSRWHQKRRQSLQFAGRQWELYAGHRADWARAVLAVMLFEAWAPGKKTPRYGSRCPWLTIWRNATWERREWEAQARRLRQERIDAREVRDRVARAATLGE